MAALPRFSGSVETTLDEKNRITIPARFKEELLKDSLGGNRVVVSKGFDKCLVIHPLSQWEATCEWLDTLPDHDPAARQLITAITGGAHELDLDRQGRLVLPAPLRSWANITREVTIVGARRNIQIWDTATWRAYSDLSDERLSQMYFDLRSKYPPVRTPAGPPRSDQPTT